MVEHIRAALTHAQNKQLEVIDGPFAKEEVKKIMTTIQEFVDHYESYFEAGELNIYAIEAYPSRRKQSAQTAFIMVNLTGKTICEVEATLALEVPDFGVSFEPVKWQIGADYLGNWGNQLAILVVDDVPMTGRATKTSYGLEDLTLRILDLNVTYR